MQLIRKVTYLILMVGCGALYAAQDNVLLANKWSLVILQHQPVVLEKFTETKPYLKFATDNTFSAFIGCNQLSGSYVATPPNSLKFMPNATSENTKNTCSQEFIQLENTFISMLQDVQNWSVSGNFLALTSTPENTVAILTSVEPY